MLESDHPRVRRPPGTASLTRLLRRLRRMEEREHRRVLRPDFVPDLLRRLASDSQAFAPMAEHRLARQRGLTHARFPGRNRRVSGRLLMAALLLFGLGGAAIPSAARLRPRALQQPPAALAGPVPGQACSTAADSVRPAQTDSVARAIRPPTRSP